jgi:hypothetical protein
VAKPALTHTTKPYSTASAWINAIAGSLRGEKLKCMITWSMPTDNGIDIHGESAGYGG